MPPWTHHIVLHVRPLETTTELADAAGVLSLQLRAHLDRLSLLIHPHATVLDARFRARLRKRHYDTRQIKTLSQITAGAAASILSSDRPAADFFELVEYSGRRLAKLNLPPSAILQGLQEYDRLLVPVIDTLTPEERAMFTKSVDSVKGLLEACKKLEPVVAGFTDSCLYFGEFGAASRVKLVNNLLVAIHIAATAEAMALGLKAGVDVPLMIKAIANGSGGSTQFSIRAPWMAERRFTPVQGSAGTLAHYFDMIADFADSIGVATPLLDCVVPL